MGYRRPHHRRGHIRTNPDGSKSYVKESDVKGHDYNRKPQHTSSNSSIGNGFDELLATISIACLILFILGTLLRWDDTLWYFVVFIVSLVWSIVRNK